MSNQMKPDISILYEDQDVLVVNKPAGLVATRSQTTSEPTLQDYLESYLKDKVGSQLTSKDDWEALIPADFSAEYGTPESIFEERVGLAHRLDKDTSGVVVVAKNPGALLSLLSQFKKRETQKEYVCLTHGKFSVTSGEVNAAVMRDPVKRQQFTVRPDGRPALTEYKVEEYYPNLNTNVIPGGLRRFTKHYQGFSLVTCWPKTGRTHQIRVHMAFIKHPLVGDQMYVGKKRVKLDAQWCPRQFLHARSLTFKHPRTNETISVAAPLPADLQKVLTFFEDEPQP